MSQSKKISRSLAALNTAAGQPPEYRLSIERLLANGIEHIELLRSIGLTWGQIALGLPSWRQQDGTPITPAQIRGAVSRIRRKKPHVHAPKDVRPSRVKKVSVPPSRVEHLPGSEKTYPASANSSLGAQLKLTTKMRMG
jgi:hypothetical protein